MTYPCLRNFTLRKLSRSAVAAFMLASGVLWVSNDLQAQKIGSSLGGFSSSSNQPIDIESDTLEVQDANKIAIFSGNVIATQGKMTMRSKLLKVKYAGEDAKTPSAGTAADNKKSGSSRITSIRAEGKVLINTADDQTVTSDWALFDVISQTVTIGGNVVLSQAGNVIKGEELVIDLKTNRSRFVNRGSPAKPQRVRGLFMPGGSGKSGGGKKSVTQ